MLGFAVPQFGESAHLDVGELARFASTAEQLGADSLWVGDRLLAAVHPTVGYAGTDTIPEQFRTSLDPFIALTVAATVTTKARLGSSVFVAPWYPPAQLAPPADEHRRHQRRSAAARVRHRLVAGGVSRPQAHRFIRRGAQLDELLDALDALWTTNPVQHTGDALVDPRIVGGAQAGAAAAPADLSGRVHSAGAETGRKARRRLDGRRAGARRSAPRGMLNRQRQAIDEAARAAGRDPSAIHTYVGSMSPKALRWTRSPTPWACWPTTATPTHSSTCCTWRPVPTPTWSGWSGCWPMSGGLLESLRVLDLGGAESDPVSRLFADLGADVLKIEPPAGSPARHALPNVAGASIPFALHNANKRSAVLDPDSPADRDRLIELARRRRHRGGRRQSGRPRSGRRARRWPSGSATWLRCRSPISGRRVRTPRGRRPIRCCTPCRRRCRAPGRRRERRCCRRWGSRRRPRRCRPHGLRWPPTITGYVAAQANTSTFRGSRRSCSHSIRRSDPRARRPSG